MTNLLYAGLSTSLLIGIAGLLRLCLGKKIPCGAFYLLWRLLAIRLLLPFSIPVEVFWPKSPASQPKGAWRPGSLALPNAGSGEAALPPWNPPQMEAPAPGFDWAALLLWTWIAGAALLAAGLFMNHLRWRRVYAQALPVNCPLPGKFRRKIRVGVSDRIRGPLTYGFFRPVVLLPQGTAPNALPYVLAHEAVHIQRLDNGFQWLLAAALCLHWMNPLVWALAFFFHRDMELSCDEAVLRQNPACRRTYAYVLLAMAERERRCPSLSASFSKHPIKERIVSIMNFKPNTLPRAIIAIAAVAAVSLLSIATIFRPTAPQDVLAAPENMADALPSGSPEKSPAPEENTLPELPAPEGSRPEEPLTERREGEPDAEPADPPSSQESIPENVELPEGQMESGPVPDETAPSPVEELESQPEQNLILPVSLTSTGHGDHHSGHHSEEGNWVSCHYGDYGHCGMDIACPMGTAVCAAGAGTVIQAGWDREYGHCVIIDHGNGLQTRYGHNSQLLVEVGDTVSQGQQIAQSGSSGLSTGPHCHFEVLNNGEPCDPSTYCVF